MSTATLASTALILKEKRHLGMGIFFLIVAVAIAGFFAFNTTGQMTTTFGLNPGARTNAPRLEDLEIPTQTTLWLLTVIVAFAGGWQLAKGFKRVNLVLLAVALIFIFAFLTWAARGASMNLLGMISASLLRATPIALGALSGILCERSGVVNIAIEGMMLSGAMVSVLVASLLRNYKEIDAATGQPVFPTWLVNIGQALDQANLSDTLPWYLLIGLLAAMLTGGILAAFHAWLSIQFKVDQIVSGTVINIFAAGFTSFLSQRFLQPIPALNTAGTFRTLPIPGLSGIPIIGPLFFENSLIVYILLS
ncbi:MAG: hypothetical protein U0401_06320 [Anaerolineae bacterium]